ncbi:MAG: Trm112 family protein [Dokdonella sp.]
MDKRLLDILCCPVTKSPLRLLTETELTALNSAILAGDVVSANGTRVRNAIVGGLITRDARSIYRLDDDIPVMLADEAIAAAQLINFPRA